MPRPLFEVCWATRCWIRPMISQAASTDVSTSVSHRPLMVSKVLWCKSQDFELISVHRPFQSSSTWKVCQSGTKVKCYYSFHYYYYITGYHGPHCIPQQIPSSTKKLWAMIMLVAFGKWTAFPRNYHNLIFQMYFSPFRQWTLIVFPLALFYCGTLESTGSWWISWERVCGCCL